MVGYIRPRCISALAFPALVAGIFALTTGCQHSDAGAEAFRSLYDRLGGETSITYVVDDFISKAAADPLVNFTRMGHPNHWIATTENVARFKKHLVQFIDKATGGPQKYEGGDMAVVHAGMGISQSEWDAAVADLKAALSDNNVRDRERDDLLVIVAGTRDQIVGK